MWTKPLHHNTWTKPLHHNMWTKTPHHNMWTKLSIIILVVVKLEATSKMEARDRRLQPS